MTNDKDMIQRDAAMYCFDDDMTSVQARAAILALPAVAASQPANPVVKADSCQRVTVKPLVWVAGYCNDGPCWRAGYPGRPGFSYVALDDDDKAMFAALHQEAALAPIDTQPDPQCCLGLSPTDCADVPSRHCDGMQPDPCDAVIAQLAKAVEAQLAAEAALKEAVAIMQFGLIFDAKVADALDIDPEGTVLNVRVMPEGREIAKRSWASVFEYCSAFIAKHGGAA